MRGSSIMMSSADVPQPLPLPLHVPRQQAAGTATASAIVAGCLAGWLTGAWMPGWACHDMVRTTPPGHTALTLRIAAGLLTLL